MSSVKLRTENLSGSIDVLDASGRIIASGQIMKGDISPLFVAAPGRPCRVVAGYDVFGFREHLLDCEPVKVGDLLDLTLWVDMKSIDGNELPAVAARSERADNARLSWRDRSWLVLLNCAA